MEYNTDGLFFYWSRLVLVIIADINQSERTLLQQSANDVIGHVGSEQCRVKINFVNINRAELNCHREGLTIIKLSLAFVR